MNTTQVLERHRDGYLITTNKDKLDLEVIHHFLGKTAYWSLGRSYETVRLSIENSLCFGLYQENEQAGFARVVTDYATFAWLCDVFVLEPHRGLGLGKWLVECVVAHPCLQDLKLFILATQTAHELYRNHGGFEPLASPERWMLR